MQCQDTFKKIKRMFIASSFFSCFGFLYFSGQNDELIGFKSINSKNGDRHTSVNIVRSMLQPHIAKALNTWLLVQPSDTT